jgi:septum formation protein
MRKIILASQSPRRRELLAQIGVPFTVEVSDTDENVSGTDPQVIVQELARRKALAVASHHAEEDVTVIGADTIVVYEDEILGKPKDSADARRMLRKLSGNVHQVYTGVCVIEMPDVKSDSSGEDSGCAQTLCRSSRETAFAECTNVFVAPLSDAEIGAYIATGEPFDKAGSYGIQGIFARHIEKIEGDYTNVVGLPVGRLWREKLKGII